MIRGVLTAETERGFIGRLGVLAVLVLTLPGLAHLLLPAGDGTLRFVPPALAAALIVVASVRWRAEALLAFALFMLFSNTLALYMGRLKQADEMTVLGLVLIASWGALPRWREWFWWLRELALGVVVLAGVVSSLLEEVPIEVWSIQLALVVKAIGIFYVALWLSARRYEIAAGMKAVLAVGGLVLVLGFVELVNPGWFQQTLHLHSFIHARGPLYAVKSLFFHPVLFSWFTAFIALYAYAWYQQTRHRRALLVAALFSLGPFLGQRRRAILALFGGLLAGLAEALAQSRVAWRKVALRWRPVAITMTLIVIIFIPSLANLWQNTVTSYIDIPPPSPGAPKASVLDSGEAPPQVRVALYLGSYQIALDNFPLGGGLGRWGSWMSRVEYSTLYFEYDVDGIRGLRPSNPVNATDTFWPQIVGETGALGLVAYVGFLTCVGLGLWRAAARYRSGILGIFALGTLMVLAQALVESLASAMFSSPSRAYLLFTAIGIATAIGLRLPDDVDESMETHAGGARPQPASAD